MRNPLWKEDGIETTWDASRLGKLIAAALISLALGIGLGLLIAWQLAPVEYVNADPNDLRTLYKDDYVRMIGAAYVLDGNIEQARQRLRHLGLEFSAKSFNERLLREQQAGRDAPTLDALALLTQGLGFNAIPIVKPTAAAETSGASQPAPALGDFRLAERTMLSCADEATQARFQFFVRDAQGKDLPNIAIQIRWEAGEDAVYTGLKPEHGTGYADFEATPGNYSATILNAPSEIAEDLKIGDPPANCRNDRNTTPRGWKIIFQQK